MIKSEIDRQIIAMGGGGFAMEQIDNKKPRVCFIPTASGDSSSYIDRFYAAFTNFSCIPAHLSSIVMSLFQNKIYPT